jgi:alginate O-acetyltransferase complex protein AlgI
MGFFKKLVIADRIAIAIDPFFAHVVDSTTAGVWSLPYVYLYALQIYFDFSGYTDIALGLGLLFGFRWPQNFDRPYLATSIQEFWRRWHMTLSRFLRDYLYIPLGGSRYGPVRTCLNLMLTMLLGGLWHGAAWSFLIWGGLHGTFLIVNRVWSGTRARECLRDSEGIVGYLWRLFCLTLTFHCVCAAWCFFRLTEWTQSIVCLEKCLSFDADKMLVGQAGNVSLWLLLALYLALCNMLQAMKRIAEVGETRPTAEGAMWGTVTGVILLALVLSPGGQATPFIYFQF